ncbi:MAG: 30S ribosome-binding factor RbfA [Gemmatimonadetes bacterium]|nr:30S ribosome-binding factor RbfA [Gemmatimonadota bacterium]MCH8255914.1 30S ribosome-binding factor RbfA [Gemmatimonadota bacterium]
MKTGGSHRQERVVTMIRQILAEALTTRVRDPRVGFVTVTSVTVSADFSHATVRVSVMGDDQQKAEALAGLQHAKGYLRSLLAHATDLRTAPELHFVIDRGLEHAHRIDNLLAEINREESES